MQTEAEIKPDLEPVPIWRCQNQACKAWVREELASPQPACPLCSGAMIRSIKHLPKLVKKYKRSRNKQNGDNQLVH